jgi:hypothetical protein
MGGDSIISMTIKATTDGHKTFLLINHYHFTVIIVMIVILLLFHGL